MRTLRQRGNDLKFGEGGVDVVDVEREARDDAVFCVNLEMLSTSTLNSSGRIPWFQARI